ncbi:hypothetical protein K435DRAFT_466003 [Dendrothele bispora CBS 962.96]|uniref:Uncharacterized protein n=1 Tax=Dendrothele bispora (strain CBS 962.96) TaxID=1314807 RepID=A0A4S8MCQ7_DENBC|nr:hypothetical protein K435DRAFT_466003 [Dendrothele bispora CBS 962.96]
MLFLWHKFGKNAPLLSSATLPFILYNIFFLSGILEESKRNCVSLTSVFSDFGWQPLHNPVQPRTGHFSATWQPQSKIPEPTLIFGLFQPRNRCNLEVFYVPELLFVKMILLIIYFDSD